MNFKPWFRRLELKTETNYKFYELTLIYDGEQYETRCKWGRIGTKGCEQSKAEGSFSQCTTIFYKLELSKLNKGYLITEAATGSVGKTEEKQRKKQVRTKIDAEQVAAAEEKFTAVGVRRFGN